MARMNSEVSDLGLREEFCLTPHLNSCFASNLNENPLGGYNKGVERFPIRS